MYRENIIKFPSPANDMEIASLEEHRLSPAELYQWMALEEGVVNTLIIAERSDGTLSVVCNKDLQEAMNLIDLGIDCLIREEE